MSSSIGKLFRLPTFGESHGFAIGGILDGCPAGLDVDVDYIQNYLDKRKPGVSVLSSERKEWDRVKFLSGIFEGRTLGSPIGFLIKNNDSQSKDYDSLKDVFRPSHADFTYENKYGLRDYRGGGRSSARETANWVVAGAIASKILSTKGVYIYSYVSSIGDIDIDVNYKKLDLETIYNNNVRCPSKNIADKMKKLIQNCKNDGDSVGGRISTVIKGVPLGLGEPVFDKLQSAISGAIMSINACKGIEFGTGFKSSRNKGSDENDLFVLKSNTIRTETNNSGGIQGGISNGEDIFFRAAFKPVSTILKKQSTISNKGQKVSINPSGRHDPCVVPRAVPIVDSLTAMIILDYYLLNKTTKLSDL